MHIHKDRRRSMANQASGFLRPTENCTVEALYVASASCGGLTAAMASSAPTSQPEDI